jgi:uncharacterized protein YcbX
MRGESISAAAATQYGLAGDRAWALRETQYGGIVSARTWPAMLQLRAAWTQDPTRDPLTGAGARVRIEMPNGAILHDDDPAASRTLSEFLRRDVRLERVRSRQPNVKRLCVATRCRPPATFSTRRSCT